MRRIVTKIQEVVNSRHEGTVCAVCAQSVASLRKLEMAKEKIGRGASKPQSSLNTRAVSRGSFADHYARGDYRGYEIISTGSPNIRPQASLRISDFLGVVSGGSRMRESREGKHPGRTRSRGFPRNSRVLCPWGHL